MKPSEIRQLTTEELHRELDNRMKELFNLRFQAATEQMVNTARIRKTRKDIARLKTILSERQETAQVQHTENAR